MRSPLLLSLFALMVAAPAALVACSGSDKEASSSDSDIHSSEGTDPAGKQEGSSCWNTNECAEGLVCKTRPHAGPPPGALGMPIPSSSATHSGPPAGAMGMPLPPNTCQTPAPGEEGSRCRSASECNEGLVCEVESGSSSSGSSTGGMPPGAMGMPILHYGKCTKEQASSSSSGGMPPGAMGMPVHP